jgi:hypothetical protein
VKGCKENNDSSGCVLDSCRKTTGENICINKDNCLFDSVCFEGNCSDIITSKTCKKNPSYFFGNGKCVDHPCLCKNSNCDEDNCKSFCIFEGTCRYDNCLNNFEWNSCVSDPDLYHVFQMFSV